MRYSVAGIVRNSLNQSYLVAQKCSVTITFQKGF